MILASSRLKPIITMPMIQSGISFARMNWNLPTGVTLICSMVPLSFSPTMLRAGKKPQMMVRSITISAGTINTL